MQNFKQKLFRGPEGKIFIFGLSLVFILILFILISYVLDAKFANKIIGLVISHLALGRVPSLSFGYAAELSHFVVIFANFMMEVILVSLIYPLFVLSFKGMLKVDALEDFFNKVESFKEKHKNKFDKYGILGLFIFVFMPFWMTGPIVGSIIGYLIGINHYLNMLIIFVATAIAITLWGLFLQEITEFLMVQDSIIIWIIAIFIILIFLLVKIYK